MVDVKYTSRVNQFLLRYNLLSDKALIEMAEKGKTNIKSETPVDSGALRDANDSQVQGNIVVFYNGKEYAPYVELGTSKMSANPFMRRGLNKSKLDFLAIMVRNLKV